MKCPRCDYKHHIFDCETSSLVPTRMDVCVMCAYPIASTDDEKFVIHCCDKTVEYVAKYKETEIKEYLIISEAYLRVAINETQEELPVGAEVSG